LDEKQTQTNNILWALVVFAVILLPSFRSVDYKDSAASIGFFLLLLLRAWKFYLKPQIRFSILDFYLLLYVGWVCLSLSWSAAPTASWEYLGRFLPWIGLYLMVRQDDREDAPSWVIPAWMAALGAACLYGLMQKSGLDFYLEYLQGATGRIFSSFGNPNVYAGFLVLSWPVLLLRPFQKKKNEWELWIRIAVGMLVFINLLMTDSRAGFLSFVLQGFLLLILIGAQVYRDKSWRIVLALFAVLITAGGLFVAIHAGNRPTERLEVWKGAVRMAADKPGMGWGINQFSLNFKPYMSASLAEQMGKDNTFAEHVHNEPLEMWVELGVTGLVLAGIFWVSLAGRALRRINEIKAGNDAIPWGAIGLLLSLAGAGFTNLFDYNCRLSGVGFFLWLVAAWLANRFFDPQPLRVPALRGLMTFGLVIAAFLGFGYYARSAAVMFFDQSQKDFLKEVPADLGSAPQRLMEAIQKDPKNASLYHELGNVYAKLNKMNDAEGAYQEEIKLNSNSPGAYLNLGNIYLMKADKDVSNLDNAINFYRRASDLDPNSVEAHFNLAYVYFIKKDMRQALDEVDRVLAIDPQNAKALSLKRQILP
jgi:O-antigen ligase